MHVRRRINIASHKRGARASRVYAARVRERARFTSAYVRQVSRARLPVRAARSNGEASKSETKGAHTAFLDSIVVKRGATAARAGRCIAVTVAAAAAVIVVVVAALVLRRIEANDDGTLRHSRTILAISAARYNDIGTPRPLVAVRLYKHEKF